MHVRIKKNISFTIQEKKNCKEWQLKSHLCELLTPPNCFLLHVERLFFQVQGTNAQQLNTIEISNIFPSFAMPIAK